MPFGFWVLGNGQPSVWRASVRRSRLKCLSAFGFWGTYTRVTSVRLLVTSLKCLSAFGFWGTFPRVGGPTQLIPRLKCLSAFGFWGTSGGNRHSVEVSLCLKCLSAFGFWGTVPCAINCLTSPIGVSNAFRLLGSGEPVNKETRKSFALAKRLKCLSAFGFWGTGRESRPLPRPVRGLKCLSAFGFWGTEWMENGDQNSQITRLKCLSAFGFWGTPSL